MVESLGLGRSFGGLGFGAGLRVQAMRQRVPSEPNALNASPQNPKDPKGLLESLHGSSRVL